MRSLFLAVVGVFLVLNLSIPTLAFGEEPNREDTLQVKIDSLKIGISDFNAIEKLFGKPENIDKGIEWHQVSETDTYRLLDGYRDLTSTSTRRTMYEVMYPSKGVIFSLFTNPSELYSITITTRDISIRGLRIGDTLESVRKKLGEEGVWRTTNAIDWYWLEFERHGLRIGFERDKGQKKYPMKLARPELVTIIKIFNSKVSFQAEAVYINGQLHND